MVSAPTPAMARPSHGFTPPKAVPRFNPLIAHVGSVESARRLARFDAVAEKLAAAFWPGPLTLVMPKRPGCDVADLALAGLDSVAVRVPAHPVARKPCSPRLAARWWHLRPTVPAMYRRPA